MHPANPPVSFVELHVPDFAPVRAFYEKLGFTVSREERGEGKECYLVLEREGNVLCFWCGNEAVFEHGYFGRVPRTTPRGVGVEVVLHVADVRSLYEQVKGEIEIVSPLILRSWGAEDFRCVDPFGYYLRITGAHDPRIVSSAA